jgi:hypothetical protein
LADFCSFGFSVGHAQASNVPDSSRDGVRRDTFVICCFTNSLDILENILDGKIKDFCILSYASRLLIYALEIMIMPFN